MAARSNNATDKSSSRVLFLTLLISLNILNFLPLTEAFAPIPMSHHVTSVSTNNIKSPVDTSSRLQAHNDRRDFLSSMITSPASVTAAALLITNPSITNAAETSTKTATETQKLKPNFTQNEIASFLRPIPTYAIVDKRGVPYMVVGEDAKLSAYFFTTYDEANRILDLASKSVDKNLKELREETNAKRKAKGLRPMTRDEMEDEVGVNPWKGDGDNGARISAVPMDFSVSLASRGKIAGSYFRIAPDQTDIQDALDVEKSITDLSEGKVPLFYIDDYEITSSSSDKSQIPLYFQKAQLLEEYKKNTKNGDKPVIKVTELFSVLGQMAGTDEADEDLKKLMLVPPKGSLEKAKLCEKKRGAESPYKIGERIVVL
jgi:uncharacterized protein YkwD